MDEKQLYVRVRGKVTGPFGLPQLKSLRDRGQFRRFHEVSEDRKSWAPASSIAELFPQTDNRSAGHPEGQFADAQTTDVLKQPRSAGTTMQGTAQWYYVDGDGKEIGPVSREHLVELWQSGTILPTTLVWKEGLEDWLAISSPELGLLQSGESARSPHQTLGKELHFFRDEGWSTLGRFLLDPVGGLPPLCNALGGRGAMALALVFCLIFYLCLLLGFTFTIYEIGYGFSSVPKELFQLEKFPQRVDGRGAFAWRDDGWRKEFGRFMLIFVLTALIPFSSLAIAITIIRKITSGSGNIGFDFLTSGTALLPIGFLSPIVPLLGIGNFEVILFLYLVTICLSILILNSAFTRIIKLSDRGSILAIPSCLILTLWLSKVVIMAALFW